MRAAQDLAGYDGLIKHWMESRLTLRYTGGLVRAPPFSPHRHRLAVSPSGPALAVGARSEKRPGRSETRRRGQGDATGAGVARS